MRPRLRVLGTSILTALCVGLAVPAGARDVVWERDGWRVERLGPDDAATGCRAIRDTGAPEASQPTPWGFIGTVDGQWGLLMLGPTAERLVGNQVTVSVDDEFLLVAVPHRLESGHTMIGEFPADRMKLVVAARWLSMATAADNTRLPLAGSAEALVAAARCTNTIRQASAKGLPDAMPSPPARLEAQPEPAPRRTAPPTNRDGATRRSAGTGFYVTGSGDVLTNAHVVQGCGPIGIKGHGDTSFRPVRLRASDTAHDLALLTPEAATTGALPALLAWRRDTRLGEQIAIFGFPYLGTLASSGTFTRGDVTALAGLNNNEAHFQLSAPVQPGNSGGAVVDERGLVVGVVVAKLNALTMARRSGDIPQNVNFAIKSARAISFMESNGIEVAFADASTPRLSGPDMAERLRDSSVLIMCGGSELQR